MESKLKKQNDDLKSQERTIKISVINNKENEKKLKELEGKNRTADSEGKYILIKPPQNDKLASDFIIPATSVTIRPPSTTGNEQTIGNPVVNKGNINLKDKDKKDDNTVTQSTQNGPSVSDRDLLKKNTIQLGGGKRKITKKFDPQTISTTKEQLPIIPAGSSYEMMVPEEGVTIVEGKKKKGGTTNFLRAFNKHSKYDYMTMLKEIMGNNSLRDTMEQIMGASKDDDIKSKEMYSLPQIKTERTNKDGLNQIHSPSLKYKPDNKDKMVANKNLIVNMKTALDSLTAIDDKALMTGSQEQQLQTGNIFKDKSIKDKFKDTISVFGKSTYNNTINNFNQTIMTNTYWGTTQGLDSSLKRFGMTETSKKFYKPDLKEIEMELGKKMVKSKLPRARMRSDIKDPEEFYSKPTVVSKNSSKKV